MRNYLGMALLFALIAATLTGCEFGFRDEPHRRDRDRRDRGDEYGDRAFPGEHHFASVTYQAPGQSGQQGD